MRQFQVPTFISHLVPVILISALVCLLMYAAIMIVVRCDLGLRLMSMSSDL
jgi:nucleoside permease NupC